MKQIIIKITAITLAAGMLAAALVITMPYLKKSKPAPPTPPSPQQIKTVYSEKKKALKSDASVAVIAENEPEYLAGLKAELEEYGLSVDVYDWKSATDSKEIVFNAAEYPAVIYTDAARVPEELLGSINAYANAGGGLILIGGPAFTDIYSRQPIGYIFSRKMAGSDGADETDEESGEIQLDCVSPAYQTFPVTSAVKLESPDTQAILPAAEYPLPAELFSPSPRTQGTGIDRLRQKRFVPLIEALDADGEAAGFAAYMVITAGVSEQNSTGICVGYTVNDEAFYTDTNVKSSLACVTAYICNRTYIYAGGTDEFAYLPGDEWTVGSDIISHKPLFSDGGSIEMTPYTVDIEIIRDGESVYSYEHQPYDYENQYKNTLGYYAEFRGGCAPDGGGVFDVTVKLKKDGVVIDLVTHEARVYETQKEKHFVTSSGNDMYLDGKIWKCYGVNYMPSSGISLKHGEDYEMWISAAAYDPQLVRKDLRRISRLGMNSVSAFMYCDYNKDNNNLLDFLEACRETGLKLFLSIRPYLEPMYYTAGNKQHIADIIGGFDLKNNDTLIGYDIAWETMPYGYNENWCNKVGMGTFNAEWEQWLIDNYGSVYRAESAFGMKIPRDENGRIRILEYELNDTSKQTLPMRNAYRRWLSDWTAEIHARVKDDITDYDPNHMVSCRMGMYTGWIIYNTSMIGWEYSAMATALDVMGPEGYGYYSKWDDDFENAVFSVAYSRYSCERPLIWFEFGKSSWNGSNYTASGSLEQAQQEDYYKLINRMLTESGSNGIYYWWFAGGYRYKEKSDYGIFNPDGSDRPVTKLLREYASQFLNGKATPKPQVTENVDTELNGTGIFGVYNQVSEQFKAALKSGKTFSMTDESFGKTSANVPLTRLSGLSTGPLRYLNADIRRVYYKTDSGWTEIFEGSEIETGGKPITLRVVVCNSGRAKWLTKSAAGAAGGVELTVNEAVKAIDKSVDYLSTTVIDGITLSPQEGEIVLQMNAAGRAMFGEKFRFKSV